MENEMAARYPTMIFMTNQRRKRLLGLRLLLALLLCLNPLLAQERSQSGLRIEAPRPMVSQPARFPKAVVASVHELATDAGMEVLRQGGNAIDAAVAVGAALAVVHPEAGNLGGSGYALVRLANGKVTAFDYAGTVPAMATPAMFKARMEASVGYKSIAVPGTPAGLGLMHEKYGKLKWSKCLEPARRLAKDGFPASLRMELILKLQVPVMKSFPETAKVLLHGADKPLQQGEIVKQPELARTIARLQKRGWKEFYEGETARLIAADMKASGGVISEADLRGYAAKEVEPLQVNYRQHKVFTMAPSSSGGVALAVMLQVMNRYPLELGREGSVAARHLQIEAMRRGFAARNSAAAENYETIARYLNDDYTNEITRNLSLDRATTIAAAPSNESKDTTHFTVIDSEGNLVSNTYTLSGFYGSQVIAKGTGVLLNNHMGVFTGIHARLMTPGRRYPSTMSPTIVLRATGGLLFSIGTPGADTIPSTLFQVISNIVDFKMSLRDALEYPRIHASSGAVDAEPGALVFDVAERLRQMGHTLNPALRSQGDVQAIQIETEGNWRVAWSDGRRGGSVKGY
jgi:gamma-glutamyltranspeptidase/glutathione hydrolase